MLWRSRRAIAYVLVAALGTLAAAAGHRTFAAFTATTSSTASIAAAADWVAPTVSATKVAKAEGGEAGYIRAGGGYRVYASISDSGNPPSGTTAVTVDVSELSPGSTSSTMGTGSYSVFGESFGHRTAEHTASSSLASGGVAYSIVATDAADNSRTHAGSVVVDNSDPSGVDVTTTDGGAVAGAPDAGDTITFRFSEPIDVSTVFAAWTGEATDVVVRIVDGGSGSDGLTVYDATNTTQLPLASVDLNRSGYVSQDIAFGASGSASSMTRSTSSIIVTLGSPDGPTSSVQEAAALLWTPGSGMSDRAGNTLPTTVIETASRPQEF